MRRFELIVPDSLDEAFRVMAQVGSEGKLMAGGTALLVLIKQNLFRPRYLVALHRLSFLDYIENADDHLRIGAKTLIGSLERSALVRSRLPILAQAAHAVGNVRVRNMATVGGNLAHADYQSDPPTAFLALDARVKLESRTGSRTVALDEFLRGLYETALEPGEVLTEVQIPHLPPGARGVYLRYTSRGAEDKPCVGVAVVAVTRDGRCEEMRVAVGGAAGRPYRARDAENLAKGEKITDGLVAQVADLAARQAEPLPDVRGSEWYKREMVKVFTERALRQVLA